MKLLWLCSDSCCLSGSPVVSPRLVRRFEVVTDAEATGTLLRGPP